MRLSKKDVILNVFQNLLPLIMVGDTGTRSGMTNLNVYDLDYILLDRLISMLSL